MREIKFRGKSELAHQWRYGSLIMIGKNPHIIEDGEMDMDGHHIRQTSDRPTWVIPETIGQYTGLKDKNGKKIYEGDIIRRPSSNRYYMVKFDMDFFPVFALFYSIRGSIHFADYLKVDYTDTYEVVGNIYDNPELKD